MSWYKTEELLDNIKKKFGSDSLCYEMGVEEKVVGKDITIKFEDKEWIYICPFKSSHGEADWDYIHIRSSWSSDGFDPIGNAPNNEHQRVYIKTVRAMSEYLKQTGVEDSVFITNFDQSRFF